MEEYPTDEDLNELDHYQGTVSGFVSKIQGLWWDGYCTVKEDLDRDNRLINRVTFITGGWSGNESIISVIQNITMFHMMFWESSHRGGKYIYEIPQDSWEQKGFWGNVINYRESSPVGD